MSKNTIKTTFLLFIFFASLLSMNARENKVAKFHNFEIGISYDAFNASSYYNLNDSLITTLQDVVRNYDSTTDTTVSYTFDFTKTTITLGGDYYLDKNSYFGISLPLSFYKLHEEYLSDQNGNRFDRQNYSLTRFDYLELHSTYGSEIGNVYGGLIGKVQIPTGFEQGLYNHPDFPFLSDGALEIFAGSYFGARVNKVSFDNEIYYNYRAEDFKNQLLINSGISISTVPNTELKLYASMILSLASFNNAIPLNITQTVSQENNYAFGAYFKILLSDNLVAYLKYRVTLAGRNTWSNTNFTCYLGYRL